MYKKIFDGLIRRFFLTQGRAPITSKEWAKLRNQAKSIAKEREKTVPFDTFKPKIVPKGGIEELLKGPVRSKGPKGDRTWDFSKKQKKGDVIDLFASEKEFADDLRSSAANFIKNDPRFNLELAVKLRNPGVKTYGWTPGGDKSKLLSPKQRQTTLNELKKVMKHDTYQAQHAEELGFVDLTDDIFTIEKASGGRIGRYEGGIAPLVGEPSYSADFYDDRTPYKVGKIVKGIKTLLKKKKPKVKTTPFTGRVRSDLETIHLPKVKKDRLATADELEDYREILDPSGEAYIVEEGMMVKELDKMVAEQKAYERHMFLEYKKGNLDPTAGDKSPARKEFLEKKLEEMEMSGDKRLMTRDEIEELSSFDLGTEMDAAIKKPRIHTLDERTLIKTKYPGISDDLLDKILVDANPQRKAEVLATMDEFLKLRQVGKSENEAFDIITRSLKDPTKHAEGGRAGFIFGGSAGFKAFLRKLMGGRKKAFPKSIDREGKRIPDTWKKKMFPKEFEREKELRIIYLENLLTGLKHDKKMMQTIESNKALKDEGLNFLTKQLEESYAPHLKKYTDIDKDILNMEQMIANQMKKQGRKPHFLGGRIGYAGGGKTGLPAVTMGTPQMNMQQPQMPAGPQPAGIPGGTIVAQNQMQQNPWMGSQMQQGPGGMPRPQPGGMPRPMAAEGGRIGFGLGGIDKARRAFLKLMAGITAGGVAAGTGLLKLGKAAKVVPKVTETIARGADGMPVYVTDLIQVVKAKGTKDIIEGFKRSDYSTVHSYKGVEVIEDAAGNTKIKSDLGGVATDPHTGKMHEGIAQEHHMQIDKGEWIEPTKTKKGIKTHDEYVEGTVRPDMDGKMKDFEDGLDEAVHLEFKKIADEVDTLIIKKTKKASGGLAYALGE